MKTNKMISSDKVIESIRSGVRRQVVEIYCSWHSGFTNKDKFRTAMLDTRFTAEGIVDAMQYMDLLGEDDALDLNNYISSLTETY